MQAQSECPVVEYRKLDGCRNVVFCSGQIILSTLCAFLMKTRKVWLFSAHMLPLLARLCAAPHATLLTVNTFSMGLTGAGITVFLLSHLFLPYRLARAAYTELLQLEVLLFWKSFVLTFKKKNHNASCSFWGVVGAFRLNIWKEMRVKATLITH